MTKLFNITGKALSGEWGTDDENGNGIPVLRTTNFTNEGIVNFDNVVTRTITRKNIEEKFLRTGDIIIEKSGGSDKQPVGRVIYYDGPENKYLFNNFTGLLRIKNQKEWFPRYVFYSLYANYRKGGTRAFENKTTGLHNLKIDDYIERYEVADANYEKQISVCYRLDKISDIIEKRKAQLSALDELVKARFVEMFGDPVKNPKGWDYENMKSVCTKITDGEHGSVAKVEHGHPFLNAKHIKSSGEIDWNAVTYTSDEIHKRIYKRCNPEGNDVLITTTGTIGNVAIVPINSKPFTMDRGITLLKLDRTKINPHYIAWLLRQESIQQIMNANVHASAIGHLFLNKVEQIPVMLPNVSLQKEFSDFVAQTDKSKLAIQKSLEKTQLLFDSLMQEYFG